MIPTCTCECHCSCSEYCGKCFDFHANPQPFTRPDQYYTNNLHITLRLLRRVRCAQ